MKRLVLSLISIFAIVFATQATTYTVTSNADNGAGTLRQALADAANNVGGPGPHKIIFSTAMTITLNNSLSIYNDADFNGLEINGFVDAVAGPDVIIKGSSACGQRGFDISASITNMKFYGLIFQTLEYGIYFSANASGTVNGTMIQGCYFGTNSLGTSIAGTTICKSGIQLIKTSSVQIGGLGTTLANGAGTTTNNSERCLFGGNAWNNDSESHAAINIDDNSNNNKIINCYIGVNLAGTAVLNIGDPAQKWARFKSGIRMNNSSTGTVIDQNVISGAVGAGIFVDANCNNAIIKGNKIGTNAAGTSGYNVTTPANSFGNQGAGIYLNHVSGIVIGYNGGNIATERNIISGNGGADHTWGGCDRAWDYTNQMGIYAEAVTNCKISGNYIGTDVTGLGNGTANDLLYNRAGGIKIIGATGASTGNIIGGSTANEINVISGHGLFWNKPVGNATNICGQSNDMSFIQGGTGVILQHSATTSNTVSGNYIGLASDGVSPLGNIISGVELQGSANNIIGGTTVGQRNYICDNRWGIMMQEDFSAHNKSTNNLVIGNWIGLNINGTAIGNGVNAAADLAGEGGGIAMQMGSNNNKIGSTVSGSGNVISGNRVGIVIRNSEQNGTGPANTNTIYNNIIGLDPTGATAIPNTSPAGYGNGIRIEMGSSGTAFPFGNIIGGIAANQANIISGNQKSGIYIGNTTVSTPSVANAITGNYIGTNSTGLVDRGNALQGIEIVNVNNTTINSNLISGNDQNGILLTGSSSNTIQNNIIGSNVSKTAPIPNSSNGISLELGATTGASNNIIGGVAANQPNFIFNNGANGVLITGATSINNSVHKNSFSCNAARGIVLSASGNNSYAAPTIVGNVSQITFTGPVGSTIEVFETDGCATCPASPTRLQGKTYVVSGTSPYVFTTGLGFDPNKTYTATASAGSTTAAHNTSEFSTCYTLCDAVTSVTITGSPLTFCAGGSVVLTANVVGGGTTGPTYVWRQNGSIVGGNTSTFTASTAGSYTVTYSSSTSCAALASSAVTVTVNPRPTITSVATGTVCSGVAQAYTITSSIPSSFSWTRAVVTGISNAAGSGSTSSITESLINTTTSPVNVIYSITATSTTGSCTTVTPFIYTVTVNPKATITNQTPAAICSGATFTVTPTGVPTGTTYTWAAPVITGSVTGASAQATAQTSISQTLSNTGTTAATVVYTVTPMSGTCAGSTFTVTVTVNPVPAVTNQTPAAICSGTAFTVTPSGVPAGTTYTWAAPVITGSVTGASAQATPQTSISQTLTNTGTTAATVVYTVTPVSGTCTGSSFTVTVTVNPKPTVTNQTPAAICSGASFSVTPSGVPAGTTYTWAAPTGTGFSGGSAQVTPQTSISQTLTNTGTTPATAVYTVTPTSGACSGSTFTVTVTINPAPAVTVTNQTATICSGASFTVTPSGVPVGTTYTWGSPVITGSVTGASAQATPQTSISQTLTNTGTTVATVVYSVTPTSGTCTGSPFNVTVTVNPKPVVTNQTAAICSGTVFTVAPTGVPAGTTYTWAAPVVTGSVTGASAQATAQASISQTLTNNGTSDATVVYTVTPTSGTCAGSTFTVTITISPNVVVTTVNPAAICSGATTAIALTSSTASVTYNWTVGVVNGVTGALAGSGSSIAQQLSNTTTASGTVEYIVTPTVGACVGTSKTITVTVNPNPIVTSVDPAGICSGETTAIALTSSPASATYTWTLGAITGVTGAAAGSGANIAQTLTNTTALTGTVEYIIMPSLNTCSGATKTIVVTVNPKPVVTNTTPADICSGANTAITLTSTPASATFTWTVGTVVGVSGQADGSGAVIDQVLTNTTTSVGTVEYIITPTITGCVGDAKSIIVTVNPKPLVTVTASGPTAICAPNTVDLTAVAAGFVGGVFEWFEGSTSLGTANPLTVGTDKTVYAIFTSSSVCSSDPSASVTITINPNNSVAAAGDDITTCLGETTLTGNVPVDGVGSWSVVLPSTATVTPGATSNVATAGNLIDGEVYEFVYTISGACGADQTDTVEVVAGLVGLSVTASGPTDTLCVNTSRMLTATAVGGSGNFNYVWVSSDNSYTSTGTSATVSVEPVGESTDYTVVVIDLDNIGCKTNLSTVTVKAVEGQDLYIPNLITPNGDNKNDIFYLADKNTGQPMIQEGSHVEIVNRWGSRVFEADNYDNNWTPTHVSDGMYYYHITSSCGNKEYKSWLQILGNKNN
jgi:parallel beta-helix repeat protein